MPKNTKDEYRKIAKEIRNLANTKLVSSEIVNNIRAWDKYQNAKNILTYFAFGHEFDLSALEADNKAFYLTRTLIPSSLGLSIHSSTSTLEQHNYGYWQPVASSATVEPKLIDLVLVPALAFDNSGNRLGYGMGYYDRLLKTMPQATFLGVSARALIFKSLPSTSFDIAMNYIVTEEKIIKSNL